MDQFGSGGRASSIDDWDIIIRELTLLFEKAGVDESHGLKHALAVDGHIDKALSAPGAPDLTQAEKDAMHLAALLHDADDHKYFPESTDFDNARSILKTSNLSKNKHDMVIKLISLVSCSKNGNSTEGVEHEAMLYPRFADRLEGSGRIGIFRTWQYTKRVGRPAFNETSPRPTTREEVERAADPERFRRYVETEGKVGSSSFIDHFYDKLLHVSKAKTENTYFIAEFQRRHNEIVEFLIEFGRTGVIPSMPN